MNKLLALLLILAQPVYADNAIKVHTGDVVKPEFNEGTLMDKEKAEKIRDELIEKDALVKEKESYEKSIKLYEENKTIYQVENDMLLHRNIELSKALNDARETSDWVKVGYFVLGVAITGVAVYGAAKIAK